MNRNYYYLEPSCISVTCYTEPCFLLCVFLEKTAISEVEITCYNCLFHEFMHWDQFIIPKVTLALQKIILAEVLLVCQIVFKKLGQDHCPRW